MRIRLILTVVLSLAITPCAMGMVMDSAGNITDWGVTPFSLPNQSGTQVGTTNSWYTIENNYSPISYPGIGHVPSPGGASGEKYDLEEIHMRIHDHKFQALIVTSSPLSTQDDGSTFYLGDLMLSVNDRQFGVVTQSGNQGLGQGGVYGIRSAADTTPIQNTNGSYLTWTDKYVNDYGPDAAVTDIVGPWAVKGSIDVSQLLGTATIKTATFDYGGAENGTFLIEYTIDSSLLNLSPFDELLAKIAWGCGNDVIMVDGSAGAEVAPEPGTLVMLAAGVGFTFFSRRKSRKAASR
jgi:hypothetical protein